MNKKKLLRLFQKRNLIQFDETPVLKAELKSINLDKVNKYLLNLGQSPLDVENEALLVNDLINLSISIEMDNSVFTTLGGLLAFGKRPQHYFPSYTVSCGAYKGDDFLSETSMIYRQFTRNQTIASFLAGYGFMERRGKGILKIMKLCKQKNIQADFQITPDDNEFVVTLKK